MNSTEELENNMLCWSLRSEWLNELFRNGITGRKTLLTLTALQEEYQSFLNRYGKTTCKKHGLPASHYSIFDRLHKLLQRDTDEELFLLGIPFTELSDSERVSLSSLLSIRRVLVGGMLKNRQDVVLRREQELYGVLYSGSLPVSELSLQECERQIAATPEFDHVLFWGRKSKEAFGQSASISSGYYCSECIHPLSQEETTRVLEAKNHSFDVERMTYGQLHTLVSLMEEELSFCRHLALLCSCGFSQYSLWYPSRLLSYQEQKVLLLFRLMTLGLTQRKIVIDNVFAALSSGKQKQLETLAIETLGKNNELLITIQDEDAFALQNSLSSRDLVEIHEGDVCVICSDMGSGELEYRRGLRKSFKKKQNSRVIESSSWLQKLAERPVDVLGLHFLVCDYLKATPDGKRLLLKPTDFLASQSRFQCGCKGKGCSMCSFTGFSEHVRTMKVGGVSILEMYTESFSKWLSRLDFLPEFAHLHDVVRKFNLGEMKALDLWYSVPADHRILLVMAEAFCIQSQSVLIDIGAELSRAMSDTVRELLLEVLQKLPENIAVILVTSDSRFRGTGSKLISLDCNTQVYS